jgi:hypothetical protein
LFTANQREDGTPVAGLILLVAKAGRTNFAVDSRIATGISLAESSLPLLCSGLGAGPLPGTLLPKPVGVLHMTAPIADGTDVWVVVPASLPLRLTIRAGLDDYCREYGLPVYRCESEGGHMMSLCAGHLRLRN